MKDATIKALKQVLRIHNALKDGEANAKEDMQFIVATLKNENMLVRGQAMAMASTSSLIRAVKGKSITEEMKANIRHSALSELANRFNCEKDFMDENKIKLLEELLS
jgi:hypothetical protein